MLEITKDFPIFEKMRTGNRRFVYLDNAATSQKPYCVLEAMTDWYLLHNANPHRGTYKLAKAATDIYEDSRKTIASYLNAQVEEIMFCRNATEAINLAAESFFASKLFPGDEIVLPISEHHSNFLPWQKLAKKHKAQLVFLLTDKNGRISDEEINRKITKKTRIVAFAQVSNVLGTEFSAEKLIAKAHEAGAYTIVDCAQGLLHCNVNVQALDIDFLAISSHKAFGPNGIGALYGKKEHLEKMQPFLLGGEMVTAVSERSAIFEKPPLRFEAGTQDPAGVYGFAAALSYIQNLGIDKIRKHELMLTERLLQGMRTMPNLKIYGNMDADIDRHGIISFNIGGQSPLSIAFYLDQFGIGIRAGTHCAMPLLTYLGTGAACRVSLAPYNTMDDVDYFLEALAEIPRTIAGTTLKGR